MKLSTPCLQILEQLEQTVEQIHQDDFVKQSQTLSQATVGQHLRHTLEFFLCLEKGFESGLINYDRREHDKLIESDKYIAISTIARIRDFVLQNEIDKDLKLEVGYHADSDECVTIATNYYRELTYNIEHAIHHMAIMKIGVNEVAPYVKLADNFGVAVSTVRFRSSQQSLPVK
jgi:hypothetical protein